MTRCCDDFVDQEKPPDASSITMTGCCESGNVADLGNSADDQETRRSSGNFDGLGRYSIFG